LLLGEAGEILKTERWVGYEGIEESRECSKAFLSPAQRQVNGRTLKRNSYLTFHCAAQPCNSSRAKTNKPNTCFEAGDASCGAGRAQGHPVEDPLADVRIILDGLD
jgi:hypothetical protein